MKNEILKHWKFFLNLEQDLVTLGDYVEISESNYSTYSMELAKIIQLSCSEIDSVCRMLCKHLDPSNNYYDESIYSGNIENYRKLITTHFPKIHEAEVNLVGISSELRPWSNWGDASSPSWWKDYNMIKHYRHNNYDKANLENAVLALSGLMVLIMYFYRHEDSKPKANPSPLPVLFDCSYSSDNLVCAAESELPGFPVA